MLQVSGLKLRTLPDDEWKEADELSRQIKGKGLDYCPTCETKYGDEDGESRDAKRRYFFREEMHRCNCQEQIALWSRYLLAHIPEEYMRLDWNDYHGSESAVRFVNNYLDKWKRYRQHGFGAEFGGEKLGIGKTFAATHIAKEMVKNRQKVYFVPFVEMISAFERSDAEKVENRIRMTPYVVIDDIMPPHSAKQHDFYHTRFEAIIRHRTNYNLPTIITTNLSAKKLDGYYPRTYSLLAAKQKRIDMTGEDFRSTAGLENIELVENGETRPIT